MRTTRPQSTSGNSSATSSAMSASRQLCSATLSRRPVDVHEWRVLHLSRSATARISKSRSGRIGYSSS